MKKKSSLYLALCIISVAVTLIPLSNNYPIPGGSDVGQVCRMALIQVVTGLGAYLLFARLYPEEEKGVGALCGLVLYMTNPWRMDACYRTAGLNQAVVWMLLPLFVWGMFGIYQRESESSAEAGSSGKGKMVLNLLAAISALAGIAYADVRMFLVVFGFALVFVLIRPGLWAFLALVCGCLLSLPCLYRLMGYLFLNHFEELNLPLGSIMPLGYRLGEFFTAYRWKEGHPGLGMGLMICILAGIWLKVVDGRPGKEVRPRAAAENRTCNIFLGLGIFCAVMSLNRFPWDFAQRLGLWALKLISLLETPAWFFGFASFALCVSGAWYAKKMSCHENRLLAAAIPAIVILFCLGGCIYQCGALI